MKLPILSEIPVTRDLVDAFGGYNHNLRIGNGEFYDMKNLTSSHYPVISPRPKRGIYLKDKTPTGLVAKDALCYVDGADFVINNYRVPMGLSIDYDENGKIKPKTLVSMGAYVIIMPDKKWVKTISNQGESLYEHGDIESSWDNEDSQVDVIFEMTKLDGSSYENLVSSPTAPSITDAMKEGSEAIPLWLDTSSVPNALKQYATTTEMWVSIATTYIKITASGIGNSFEEGDGVTFSGIKSEKLTDLNNTMTIWAKGNDYVIVTGILDEKITQKYLSEPDNTPQPITVARKMPNMDFVIESGNRLWGCRYGVAINGEVVNEIYASKLGDFKNWHCYAGISTDSYAVTVGTDGQFTGAITHLGYPIFFKENYMHKVYGNYPANYQIQTTACRGVQKGCEKSLAIVNEVVYYKARSAVCMYDGSLPAEISSALGEEWYSNAVAGSLGNKYYISMCDRGGKYHLFVCDTNKGMWHKEDNTKALDFCTCRGDLYFIDDTTDGLVIKNVLGSGCEEFEGEFEWIAETGIIGVDMPDKKYISRMDVRMSLKVGTRVSFFVEYDSSEVWEHLHTMTGVALKSFTFPVRPRRCDHLRLRIVGDGEAKIFSICKSIEQGSDI